MPIVVGIGNGVLKKSYEDELDVLEGVVKVLLGRPFAFFDGNLAVGERNHRWLEVRADIIRLLP